MNDLILGILSYSQYLKIILRYKNDSKVFNQKLVNFDEIFFDKINEFLKFFNKNFKDISTICVVRGPGRFTSIRLLYTFAKLYNTLSKSKLYGVDVFDVIAYGLYNLDKTDRDFKVIIHAFKNEFYLSNYEIKDAKLKKIGRDEWLVEEEIKKRLKNYKGIVLTDIEDFPDITNIFPDFNFDLRHSKIFEENIINSAIYFKKTDISPIYLKPAKFL